MVKTFEAQLVGTGLKIGIVVGRFNEFINDKLLAGAIDGLKRHGVEENAIDVAWVPGAFEVPFIAKRWQNLKNMMLSSDLVQLFVELQRTMITFATSPQKELLV